MHHVPAPVDLPIGLGEEMKKKRQSKAAFVRSLPSSLSAAEVVEKAKAVGLALKEGYVYNIRSGAKAHKKTRDKPREYRNGGRGTTADPGPEISGPEGHTHLPFEDSVEILKAVGAELGLANAIALLEGERARVRAVLP
jgi:hypothetical protein